MDEEPTSNDSDYPKQTPPQAPFTETEPNSDSVKLPETPFVNSPRPELNIQPISDIVKPQTEPVESESETDTVYQSHRPDAHQYKATVPALKTSEPEEKLLLKPVHQA